MFFQQDDIQIRFENNCLTLQSGKLVRVIDWSSGWAHTTGLSYDGKALAAPSPALTGDFELAGFPPPGDSAKSSFFVIGAHVAPLPERDGRGVAVTVKSGEALRKLALEVTYILYYGLPIIGVQIALTSGVIPIVCRAARGIRNFNANRPAYMLRNVTDSVVLPEFTACESIEFQLRTDEFDEPVLHHANPAGNAVGNILFAENREKCGFFYLLEAPPSMERRESEPYDFVLENGRIGALAGGFDARDIVPGKRVVSHRAVMGVAADGDSAKLLKRYFRARRPVMQLIAGAVTVNPWGGGSFPERLNEKFLQDEIRAAGAIGADLYQIDDGYESGGTLTDLVVYNRCADSAWWALNTKLLPQGFAPLAETAKAAKLNLSLWFAPSFNQEYRDWRALADILLAYYRQYGVKVFKLDAVILESFDAEANFRKFLETLNDESNGAITVNLDVTNGVRGGICEFAEFGTIFLENRYCCHEWPAFLYSPENTLDNLWNLAHVCRIQDLQIEVANPSNINREAYAKRNLPAPDGYALDYWFAIALFASPLLWMAPSTLTVEEKTVLTKMTQLHKLLRANWRDALIAPVGSRPDGQAITGLYADSGYLLVFRELAAPASAKLEFGKFSQARRIAGNCNATLQSDGVVTLPQAGGWALFEIRN